MGLKKKKPRKAMKQLNENLFQQIWQMYLVKVNEKLLYREFDISV